MEGKNDNCMSRKEFITKMSYGSLIIFTGLSTVLASCDQDDPEPGELIVDLSNPTFSKLNTNGGWIKHPSADILLVNVEGTIRAFSSVCPHARCTDKWTYSGVFYCSCHGSTFTNDGKRISGPAKGDLTKKNIIKEGDIITFE